MPVDVLFFASVPQISLYFRTPPNTERGESHTLEHLLLGKGKAGRNLNTLMPMRMGDYTAGTHSDITNYQMSSAAGPAEFYELTETFLSALAHPDFTDEEIRREVAHYAVAEDSAALQLEEKGTVYNEMVSRMENPDSITWDQLGRMMYGPQHPLARNEGGDPPEIWKLTPQEIRDFHKDHYRLDSNAAFIAALPLSWSAEDFLRRLDMIIQRMEPELSTRPAAALPSFSPQKRRDIWIGRFPSEDIQAPRSASFVWPPVRTFSREEATRLGLALSVLADGESAYLYKDLVDQKTRKLKSGATGVGSYSDTLPASFAMIYMTGLPVSSITPETLGRLRSLLLERIRWLHNLPAGGPELAEVAVKVRALIRSARRSTLKSMDGPPGFGKRSTYADWHRFLDHLEQDPGFAKPLSADAIYDSLLAEMGNGSNPWSAALERAGVLDQPYVAAVTADPALLERQRKTRQERLRSETERIVREYNVPAQEALARYRTQYASATAILEAQGVEAGRPSFLKDPPLALDDLDWSEGHLLSGPKLIRTHFVFTPFTDIRISFDIRGISSRDYELLPLLSESFTSVGAVTRSREQLDYARVEERLRDEVYGVGADVDSNPITERTELSFFGGASNPKEVDRAVEWIENFMHRSALGPDSRERLVDLTRAQIQSLRAIFQQDEESWIRNAASAYEYQDQPLYMTLSSPFTSLRHLNRLRWRLEKPNDAELAVIRSTLTAVTAASERGDRSATSSLLEGVGGELGEYLRWELSHLPDDSWRVDLRRICVELNQDLGRADETISRLRALGRLVLVRAGARVHLNGNPSNTSRAAESVDRLLARLPQGRKAGKVSHRSVVLDQLSRRLPGVKRPVHVALINPGGKTAAISVSTPGPRYGARKIDELLDVLALGVLSGGAAHSLFMRTWAAGLAYANGMSVSPSAGVVSYYADRCPNPAQTLRFVAETASQTQIDDPFLMEYSLAGAFGDYRAADDFSSRGASMASDLEDGRTPELVRGYKRALLRLAREPGTLVRVRNRFKHTLGRALIGLQGGRVAASQRASAFMVSPEGMLGPYEAYLKEQGETDRLIRLYPRDFWP
jgi:Zn-dependent M16 (insulinase) family peptidase